MPVPDLKIPMEKKRLELIAEVELFNKKAETIGIEKIPMGSDRDIGSRADGKFFYRRHYAEEYLEVMGFERVSSNPKEFMKDGCIARPIPNPNGCGLVIQVIKNKG